MITLYINKQILISREIKAKSICRYEVKYIDIPYCILLFKFTYYFDFTLVIDTPIDNNMSSCVYTLP